MNVWIDKNNQDRESTLRTRRVRHIHRLMILCVSIIFIKLLCSFHFKDKYTLHLNKNKFSQKWIYPIAHSSLKATFLTVLSSSFLSLSLLFLLIFPFPSFPSLPSPLFFPSPFPLNTFWEISCFIGEPVNCPYPFYWFMRRESRLSTAILISHKSCISPVWKIEGKKRGEPQPLPPLLTMKNVPPNSQSFYPYQSE